MTITAGAPPTPGRRADRALGFLRGGVIGASLTAFVSGCAVGRTSLIVGGLVLPAVAGLQLTADNVTGSVTLRIVVTGDRGTRTLEADEHGKVLSRSGS